MKYTKLQAFTLIELVVSITILSLIMVSVLTLFLFSSQMSTIVEVNRVMQENIKNVMEDIAEGVRKNAIAGYGDVDGLSCNFPSAWDMTPSESLCIGNNIYTIWNMNPAGVWVSVPSTSCVWEIDNPCRVLKKERGSAYFPLTNGFVAFQELGFIISNPDMPKVTVQFKIQAAAKKWIASSMLEKNTISIQSTFSHRLINTQ